MNTNTRPHDENPADGRSASNGGLCGTIPRYLGASSDGRTGRWEITCPKCGEKFKPNTTRLARQLLQCPRMKCLTEMVADYNNDTVQLLTHNAKVSGGL